MPMIKSLGGFAPALVHQIGARRDANCIAITTCYMVFFLFNPATL